MVRRGCVDVNAAFGRALLESVTSRRTCRRLPCTVLPTAAHCFAYFVRTGGSSGAVHPARAVRVPGGAARRRVVHRRLVRPHRGAHVHPPEYAALRV